MTVRTIEAPIPAIDAEKLSFFRFGNVADKVLVTNDAGEWHFLEPDTFHSFISGALDRQHPDFGQLQTKGFMREGLDIDAFAAKIRRKKAFVGQGPHLHIVLTTLRCNQSCRYCHASRTSMDRVDTDMTRERATKTVDLIMSTTSPYVNIEFQGGEPTVNFPILQYIVEYSREKNKYARKDLEHSLVTNMTYMTEEHADWIVDNHILTCTSLDGPEELHNWNRTMTGGGGNAYADVVGWIRRFNEKYVAKGRDPRVWHIDALMTTTRKTLALWREVIDLYVSLGIKNVHLRPLNPYGFALGSWKNIGYSGEEYAAFYERSLDYIIELNRRGVEVMEASAALFLVKMLTPDDPNYVDIRSPAGAGTGALTYNYDGRIFPSDEGRMLAAMGNEMFELGNVDTATYHDLAHHPTVKSLALASIQDGLPGCATCWNKPYCGVDPMDNYMVHGDIFGQRPLSPNCKEYYTISRLLFERLSADSTGDVEKIFRRWTLGRPREMSA